MNQPHQENSTTRALALGALGVVFGDIGTSPLYTMKEVFGGHHLALSQDNVLGILSLIFWSLMLVVSLKYVSVMMRAFAIDTLLVGLVMHVLWGVGRGVTLTAMLVFLTVDLAFFGANVVKIPDGGWFPLMVALIIFTLLVTWKRGREIVTLRLGEKALPLAPFVESLLENPPILVPGTAVFMTSESQGVPLALLHNLKHNKVLHERVVILNVRYAEVPYVPADLRLELEKLAEGFYHVVVRYGFMDDIDIPKALSECPCGMQFDMMDTTFFFSRENLIPTRGDGMSLWREHIFAAMARNAASPMTFFHIPANRVVELGAQLEI